MTQRRTLLGAILAGSFFTSTAFAQTEAHPQHGAVPPLKPEDVPPPRPGYTWEPGHWHWASHEYEWRKGHWIESRAAYHQFIHGRWERKGGDWAWRPAHWE
jgi:hypothetical protein